MSKQTGKTITDIIVNKNTVTIHFSKGKMSVSHEAYSTMYLYVGKTLLPSEIKKLKEADSLTKGLNFALNSLKKKVMSSYEVISLLKKKSIDDKTIKKILKQLKEYNLINDSMYIEDMMEYYNELNYGEYKIKAAFKKKGFSEEEINKIKFSVTKEKQKAAKMLPKLEKKYERLNYIKKKESIFRSLINLGFRKEIILPLLDKIKKDSESKIKENIQIDYERALRLYENKYEGRELKDKIFLYLKKKGYSSTNIKMYMEERSYETY